MTRSDRTPRLAVLIDADNASPRIAAGLFEEIAKIGEASVRRIYGDFSSSRSQGWADVLARFAIIPHQQFAYVTGKNASDITLVIDAMDLLHSGRLDGFCLVSSDSDFTRLAARIREQGIDVFGFGEKKTPESFRQACRRFIYTENLLPERAPNGSAQTPQRPLEQPETAADLLRRVVDQMDTEDGWVSLGAFGKQIANVSSDFDPRTYGFKKLSDLIRSTGTFTVDDADPGRIRVRLKTGAAPARRAAATAEPARPRPEPDPAPAPAPAVAAEPVALPPQPDARSGSAAISTRDLTGPSGVTPDRPTPVDTPKASAEGTATSPQPRPTPVSRGAAARPRTDAGRDDPAPGAAAPKGLPPLSPAALAAHVAALTDDEDDAPAPRRTVRRPRTSGR